MDTNYLICLAKHAVKGLIGRPDPTWPGYDFEHSINAQTVSQHERILAWAEQALAERARHESAEAYQASEDPIVRQGYALRKEIEAAFRNSYASVKNLRVLMHLPDERLSPGGYSALANLAESLAFIGIPTRTIAADESTADILASFSPTVFLIIDHSIFLKDIDWKAVAEYRRKNQVRLGLLAQLAEDGNTPLPLRLAWAKEHAADFYFSFKDEAYLHERADYQPFYDAGYKIISVPFGANPLHYYPVAGSKDAAIVRDLDYSFIGSIGGNKAPIYHSLAKKVVHDYSGFIDGPRWRHVRHFSFNRDRDRYIYARSKIGLNFHNPLQMRWANEVNERTHQLALCGVPQVVDTPKLLPMLYSRDALFMAESGKEFTAHFRSIIKNPALGRERALRAQQECFAQHTTFHRASAFAGALSTVV